MKCIGTAALLFLCFTAAFSQQSKQHRYTLPAGIHPADYVPGKILVKAKAENKMQFRNNSTHARQSLHANFIRPIAPVASTARTARAKNSKPVIDITQYFEINFDPAVPVEQYINTMLASGVVEYAEPVYREQMDFVPNDPNAGSQYYLDLINAYEAWDVTQGSEDIIIGIVDSGGDLDHPDLASQLYVNANDPVNGVDDDGNGYIDDYRGWDFSGDDTLNVFNASFKGDNNPQIFKYGPGFTHGTAVAACASASTNDGVGIAGVGYKSKLLFTKHFADNQPVGARSYNSNTYLGLIYVAQNGARIINCSWGSAYRSQVYQDIITHVTLDLGCLVVAAAGNDGTPGVIYPAGYDYVLSVAATDANDKKASFTNYNSAVDISAPGVNVLTAIFDNDYEYESGTSFSSPIAAGAAALVLAQFPDYTPMQLAEQLRISADQSLYNQNPTFMGQLGRGRLDIYQALTLSSPSIRASNTKLVNFNGTAAEPGQDAFLSFDFTNYLQSSSAALSIQLQSSSTYVTITHNVISPGVIASSSTYNNASSPFALKIDSAIPDDTPIDLKLTYTDGAYQDTQVISFVPNPSYRNIDDNLITTSIASAGQLGYESAESSTGGVGFIFNDKSLLFEMGLIMGTSGSDILNTVRNNSGGYDQDFVSLDRIREITPGERADSEIFGSFSNSTDPTKQKIIITYRSLVWRDAPYDKFAIVEYKVRNPQSITLSNFHFGIFADWDISFAGSTDAAGWNADSKLGFVYPKQSTDLPHAGIQLLTGNATYYALDNDSSVPGNPFGLYDGFTDTEKFISISTNRLSAGNSGDTGNDVSHVVAAGPFTLGPNHEITIAFALHAANNLDDLVTSSLYADTLYHATSVTATEPLATTLISVYPNPTRHESVTVLTEEASSTLSIALLDATGLRLQQQEFTHTPKHFATTLSVRGYAPGMYLVMVRKDQRVLVQKLLVK